MWFWMIFWLVMAVTDVTAQPNPILLVQNTTSFRSRNTNAVTASDGKGGFFVVWQSQRADSNFSNLFAQHIDANGKMRWSTDGLQISPFPAQQAFPQVLSDGLGGMIVVWEDGRNPENGTDIYAQRVDSVGQSVWGATGFPICSKPGNQNHAKILTHKTGKYYIFWEDYRNDYTDIDVYGQLISDFGRIIWEQDGVPVAVAMGDQQKIQLASDSNAGVIVVWEDFRSRKHWELYAQKLDSLGKISWDSSGINLLSTAYNQKNASLFGDGFGGFVCAFEAEGNQTKQTDIWMMRISRTGKVSYQEKICHYYEGQFNPTLVKKGAFGIVFWEDYRSGEADIYGQRFDIFNGEAVWEINGIAICSMPGNQTSPKYASQSEWGDFMLVWKNESQMIAQSLDKEGKKKWASNGIVVSDSSKSIETFAVLANLNGSVWAVFNQDQDGGLFPFYQKIETNGTKTWQFSKPLFADCGSVTSRLDELRVIQGLNGDIYMAWKDFRNGDSNADIYVQRVDTSGQLKWRVTGIPVCTAPGEQGRPTLLALPDGLLVGWVDRREKNNENLYIQKIDTLGRIQWKIDGNVLCNAPKSQNDLQIVAHEGQFLFFWTDARDLTNYGFDVYMQLVSAYGFPLYEENGRPLARLSAYQNSPVAIKSNRTTFVEWMDDRNGYYNLYLQKFDSIGKMLLPAAGIPINRAGYHHRNHQMLAAGDHTFFAWTDERWSPGLEKIYVQKIGSKGLALWNTSGIEACPIRHRQITPKMIQDSTGNLILCWLDERNIATSGFNLNTQRLDQFTGRPTWVQVGLTLGDMMEENSHFTMAASKNYIYYFWSQRGNNSFFQIFWQGVEVQSGNKLFSKTPLLGKARKHQSHPHVLMLDKNQIFTCWLERDNFKVEDRLMFRFLK